MNVNYETEKSGRSGGATRSGTTTIPVDLKTTGQSHSPENENSTSSVLTNPAPNLAKTASKNRQERRNKRRASIRVLARLRPADSKDDKFEEILTTRNATRTNLYVISASRYYYKSMPLRVTFPFNAAHDSGSTAEQTGEVVRLDHLPDGRVGVAIQLRQPIASTAQKSSSTRKAGEERRFVVRHMISASAKLIEMQSRIRLEGRCSDVSVGGCYIDTLNPFPEGAKVLLQLTNNQSTFVVTARVVSHHVGMGMALVFDVVSPEQRSVLEDWLGKRSAPTPVVAAQSASAGNSVNPQTPTSLDRALIVKLVQLLESDKSRVVDVVF